jgi:hypothetical protein
MPGAGAKVGEACALTRAKETLVTRLLVAALALLVCVGFAHAQGVQGVEIQEFGTYTEGPKVHVGWTRNGLAKSGVYGVDLVESTQTIVARLGVSFGFRYTVKGKRPGAPLIVTIASKMPAPGVFAPNGSVPFTSDEETWPVTVGGDTFYLWTFGKRSDLVPGIWTFEVWIDGQKYAEQKFNVILPPIAGLANEKESGA